MLGFALPPLLLLGAVLVPATTGSRPAAPALRPATHSSTSGVPSARECLDRPRLTTASGGFADKYQVSFPPDGTTFDLRRAVFHSYQDENEPPYSNTRPVALGFGSRPDRMCVVGGVIAGYQSRSLGWEELKHCDSGAPWDYPCSQDGTALLLTGTSWYLADGVRIDNTMDALGGGEETDHAYYRNLYARYIRDDCIGNDRLRTVVVSDSLFDGCYVGVSQDPRGSPDRDTSRSVTLDHVLLRLKRMPGGYRADTSESNHGKFFKWSDSANRLIIRDSILLAEHSRFAEALDFPRDTVASNVKIVWLGSGPYPGSLVPGVSVTTDVDVWNEAKDDWLERHGCSSFAACDPDKLIDPDPPR